VLRAKGHLNSKTWVNASLFLKIDSPVIWFWCAKYCVENYLPFKALLILYNAPGHHWILKHPSTKINIFLPPNRTAMLQPVDQGLISSFKAYYLGWTFTRLVKAEDLQSRILEFLQCYGCLEHYYRSLKFSYWSQVKGFAGNCAQNLSEVLKSRQTR
jgi:hypothetical protein